MPLTLCHCPSHQTLTFQTLTSQHNILQHIVLLTLIFPPWPALLKCTTAEQINENFYLVHWANLLSNMINFHLNHMTNYLLPHRMPFSLLNPLLRWRWRHLYHLGWGGGTSTTSGDECTTITPSSSSLQRKTISYPTQSLY